MSSFKFIKKTFKKYIALYNALYKDRRTPKIAKVFLWMALGYIMLPFDLIPDFVPIIGHLDDVIIVPSLIFIALKFIPSKLYQEHRRRIFALS